MQLERIDVPAPLVTPSPDQIKGMGFRILEPPFPAHLIPNPEPHQPIPDSGFLLKDFPDYEFAADGTPTRVAHRPVGPKPPLGEVKPVRVTSKSRYYSLTNDAGRVTVSDKRIRDMLAGRVDTPTSIFSIDDFPNTYFDSAGTAYSAHSRRPLAYRPLETTTGRTIKRYRLYSLQHDGYRWFTDVAARRYRDGRCSLTTAEVPVDCVLMGDEFPDWAIDIFTGQPYRVQSKRYAVYEPIPSAMRRDGTYFIQNYAGERQLFKASELLEYVGSPHAPAN